MKFQVELTVHSTTYYTVEAASAEEAKSKIEESMTDPYNRDPDSVSIESRDEPAYDEWYINDVSPVEEMT